MWKYWKNLTSCGQTTVFISWIIFGWLGVMSTMVVLDLLEDGVVGFDEALFGITVNTSIMILMSYILYRFVKCFDRKFGCKHDSCKILK